jgi:tetratricopeptide (TPR) repeat protein
MRNLSTRSWAPALTLIAAFAATPAWAQTFTMNKECRAAVAAANGLNDAKQYAESLSAFDAIVDQCDTKDGKEAVQVGRARALNGLGRHEEAITAADAALEVTKDTSLFAYFERAYAQEQMGMADSAAADYNRIIELTEKNQNVAERATIYAKVADLNYKAGKPAEAEQYLAKAMELDPGNPNFAIQRGDWAAWDGNYDAAFVEYDKAVAAGKADVEMYQIRSNARIRQMESKYGTNNVQELRGKMTPEETRLVCSETTKAIELGLKDMKMDMFAALVCR